MYVPAAILAAILDFGRNLSFWARGSRYGSQYFWNQHTSKPLYSKFYAFCLM